MSIIVFLPSERMELYINDPFVKSGLMAHLQIFLGASFFNIIMNLTGDKAIAMVDKKKAGLNVGTQRPARMKPSNRGR
jgi:hypothetical protein